MRNAARTRDVHQRAAAALRRRIESRFQTVTETVTIGGVSFPFTRVRDPDKVLDEVAAEESRLEKFSGVRAGDDQRHRPYWAELWDSAMGIAQWLARRSRDATSLNTLVLGCGMGLAGTAAAALGHRVTFAVLEAPALLFARLNSLPWGERVRTRRLNWQTDQMGETFDLILGADILYERKQWPFLEPFWRGHLSHDGRVLLGEPGRQTGDLFIEWLASRRGWTLAQHEEPVTTREKPIRLFELTQAS